MYEISPCLNSPMLAKPANTAALMLEAHKQATIDLAVKLSAVRPVDWDVLIVQCEKLQKFEGKPNDEQKRQLKELEQNVKQRCKEVEQQSPDKRSQDEKIALAIMAMLEKMMESLFPKRSNAPAPR